MEVTVSDMIPQPPAYVAPDVDFGPLFDTPQITTDDDGRHWDGAGREHRLVDVDGEATFAPLTSWEAPAWTTASKVRDHEVAHTRTAATAAAVDVVDCERTIAVPVTLEQLDEITIGDSGVVRVDRGAPWIWLGGELKLTPAAARVLGDALLGLAALVDDGPDDGDPHGRCATCGQSGDEHALAVHAFVGGEA